VGSIPTAGKKNAINILGNGEAALWGWCGLGTWRGCGITLAKKSGHQFFVVVFAHFGLVWFHIILVLSALKIHDFSFVSIKLHPRLFAPCLTCVYHHLVFESISRNQTQIVNVQNSTYPPDSLIVGDSSIGVLHFEFVNHISHKNPKKSRT